MPKTKNENNDRISVKNKIQGKTRREISNRILSSDE